MTSLLLTGASGFIGSRVLRTVLRETDWRVVCPVSFRHKGLPERIVYATAGYDKGRVGIVHCDLAAPIGYTTARLFGDVNIIVNLASDTHPPRSLLQPVEFTHNNVDVALYLLEYARTLDHLRAFVQIGTDAVYGDALEGAHREWDPTQPQNVYAATKAMQEALAIAYWRSYGVPVMLTTVMNPVGETQDPEKFIPSTIGKILHDEPVTVHTAPGGDLGKRTYIDADDVADAFLFLLGQQPPGAYPQALRPNRWNITGPRELDNEEVVDILGKSLGLPAHKELMAVDRPDLGHRYALDGSKLTEAGWKPSQNIEDSLQRIANWYRRNPMWLR